MMDIWDELKKYRGLWVALHQDEVIASGKSAKPVFEKAKKVCEKPIVFQVPRKEEEVCIL
ncbi:MAG: DUF5678 domain-containing protein [Methanocellales archaeon]|nr:DUF5678 domain-containing protein [Methanocellales archaeon]MDI6903686.1 DUF5678 domain-containing protein [Methanocellales archaeon]